ncbi:hypothetical protein [Achromobacter marplatensis]|uniref:Uncharacterized protein n=3 Tax=Achromobacter marplatensis TaxID=470868 RepID=A0AA42W8Z1_9BURK|nr:hypothetical protein [Achromobacter marplatensis]MDH2050848.1 hypothetical protein [Achromobacter marplatensis]
MDYFINLCEAYLSYVKSGFEKKRGADLVFALAGFGLPKHAEALDFFLSNKRGIGICDRTVMLGEMPCIVSVNMPESAEGSCWFDPRSIDFFIKQKSKKSVGDGGGVWVGTNPVRIWQYLVFLKLAKVAERFPGSIDSPDFLKSRFLGEISSGYVVNIYHQEAKIFAAWHGRHLASHFDLNLALENLGEDLLDQVLPNKMNIWNGLIVDEDRRLIMSSSSSPAGEVTVRECEEWFRHKELGMITCVIESLGLNRTRLFDHFCDDVVVVNNHLCRL